LHRLVVIGFAFILLACSGSPPVSSKPGEMRQPPLSLTVADSLWSLRADSTHSLAALHSYRRLFQQDTASIPLGAKLSRAYYHHGQYFENDPSQRDSLFMKGYQISQKVFILNADYHELLFSTGDENIAIKALGRTYLDLMYWGMANYGQWLATKGRLIRLGQREIIWTTLEHINDLDSTYYFGAYYRYKGALMSRDPEFQTQTDEIRACFEMARQISPKYLGNNTLMAGFYCPLTRDKDLFYKLLTEVITASSDPKLPFHPENLCEKKRAERLMIKAEKEKWFDN
jgi:hypothetical protein